MNYSKNGMYPEPLPDRIRLPNGDTRTKPLSQEDLQLAGYVVAEDPPVVQSLETFEWTGTTWVVYPKSQQEIDSQWINIRKQRDEKIKEVEWRYNRYYRHERLGLPQIDSLQNLDTYIQALADITKQTNPYAIIWPVLIV